MDNHELIPHIQKLREEAVKNFSLSEKGIIRAKRMNEADEDIIANYYDEDRKFINECIIAFNRYFMDEGEFLYYQAFLDCIKLIKKYPQILEDDDLKQNLLMLRN